jgi:transposase
MGKFILLNRGEFSWVECLSLYRSKDVVEKGFDVLKNDIDLMPANLRTNSSLRGYLFIAFIALILRMKLMRILNSGPFNNQIRLDGNSNLHLLQNRSLFF